jgi:hypothetical protein
VGVIETAFVKSCSAFRAFANKLFTKKNKSNKKHAHQGQTLTMSSSSQAGSPRTSCAGADTTTMTTTTVDAAASVSPADGTTTIETIVVDNINNPAAAATDSRTSSGGDSATSAGPSRNIFRRGTHKIAKRAGQRWSDIQKAFIKFGNTVTEEVTFGKVSLAANNPAVQVYAASG